MRLPMTSGNSSLMARTDLVEGMLNPQIIEDTVHLIREAIKREKKIAVIINNRAGGNGPLITQQIAKRFLNLHG
jgi:hypothetical protein